MTISFCSFSCKFALALEATSASKSCMTFNMVYCSLLKKQMAKGVPCPVTEKDFNKKSKK